MSLNDKDKLPYCGCKPLVGQLKNRRYGSALECAKKGQISRYGEYKVDSRLIDYSTKAKSEAITLEKVRNKKIGLDARVNKLSREIPIEKDTNKKLELQKQLNETIIELERLKPIYKELLQNKIDKQKNKLSVKKPTTSN